MLGRGQSIDGAASLEHLSSLQVNRAESSAAAKREHRDLKPTLLLSCKLSIFW